MDEKILYGNTWIMFHGMLNVALGLPKLDGFGAKLGVMAINYIVI